IVGRGGGDRDGSRNRRAVGRQGDRNRRGGHIPVRHRHGHGDRRRGVARGVPRDGGQGVETVARPCGVPGDGVGGGGVLRREIETVHQEADPRDRDVIRGGRRNSGRAGEGGSIRGRRQGDRGWRDVRRGCDKELRG